MLVKDPSNVPRNNVDIGWRNSLNNQAEPNPDTLKEDDTLQLIKELLIDLTFKGNYIHRKFVQGLNKYRDEIVIDTRLHNCISPLRFVKKHLANSKGITWTGIDFGSDNTDSLDCSLLLQLRSVPFGEHTFRITALDLIGDELQISVEVSEQNEGDGNAAFSEHHYTKQEIFNGVLRWGGNFLKELITPKGCKEGVRMIMVFLAMLSAISWEAFRLLVMSTVQLIKVFPDFVTAIMPLLLAIVEAWNKCIGGFYLLLWAMFGNENRNPTPRNPRQELIDYNPGSRRERRQ